MKTKSTLSVLLWVMLAVSSGCRSIVNKIAFHPDTTTCIPRENLPHGVKEVLITTEDGVKIQSYFLDHKSSDKLVVFFHGNAGNISHRLFDLLQMREFRVSVLGVGYRGYGKSEGKPTEKGIYLDGKAALGYATNELGFQLKAIYVFGRSIGTTVAINTSQKKNIAGLVLVTPLTSGKELAKASGLSSVSFLAGKSFNNIHKIRNISCPVMVIHGTDDHVIPYGMGVDIYGAVRAKKELVTINGGGHNNLSVDFRDEYWPPIYEFITN